MVLARQFLRTVIVSFCFQRRASSKASAVRKAFVVLYCLMVVKRYLTTSILPKSPQNKIANRYVNCRFKKKKKKKNSTLQRKGSQQAINTIPLLAAKLRTSVLPPSLVNDWNLSKTEAPLDIRNLTISICPRLITASCNGFNFS